MSQQFKLNTTLLIGAACTGLILASGAAQAAPINPIPGAITCTVGEPGGVGDDFDGFLDPETGKPEIELEGFDSVECGPNTDFTPEPPNPLPPVADPFPYPGEKTDDHLHGLFELHGMYGFFNNGVYGVYNLHGIYNVQGILHDGAVYNFDRFGDAAAPSAVPVPAAAWLFGSGLLGLAGVARRKVARG